MRIAVIVAFGFFAGCSLLASSHYLVGGKIADAIDRHAAAVDRASEMIGHPEIRMIDPVPIKDPVKIRGLQGDGSIDINAEVGKEKK